MLRIISQNKLSILWHGTSEPAQKILSQGLTSIPVFLTDNPELAIDYAETDQQRSGLNNITVVKVNINMLDQTLLIPDLDHGLYNDDNQEIETWEQSLHSCDQCAYNGVIPPNAIALEKLI